MSSYIIPTAGDPFSDQVTALEGVDYLLGLQYNQREDCWYLSVSLTDGTPLASGVKLIVGVDLIERFADKRLPPGHLCCISVTSDLSPPGLGELGPGLRCELGYVTSDDIPSRRNVP